MNTILERIQQPKTRDRFTKLNERLTKLCNENRITQITPLKDFFYFLDEHEADLAKAFLFADPAELGLRTPILGIEKVPEDVIIIDNRKHLKETVEGRTPNQYMPKQVFGSFTEMRYAYASDNLGRNLLIESGYRSPAYQIVTLVYILVVIDDFDLAKTLKRAALPTCSQHCSPKRTALDLANIDRQPTEKNPQDFAQSTEYTWLKSNAHIFNFYESYPPDNPEGIMWEPWHWQYRPTL